MTIRGRLAVAARRRCSDGVSLVDANEVFRFVLAIGLGAVIFAMAPGIRIPHVKVPFAIGYLSMALSYLLSILEDVAPSWKLLHVPQHALSIIAGAAFVLAAWQARRFSLEAKRTRA
jgi:hypothetical protein